MAIIPNPLKLSFYDPSKPGGVITIQEDNPNSPTNLATQFSMQDIIDTVSAGGGPVNGTGTPGTIPVWSGITGLGDSIITERSAAGIFLSTYIETTDISVQKMEINSWLADSTTSTGSAGDVLTSTGGGAAATVAWLTPSGGSVTWPYAYNLAGGRLLQGENPGTTQVGVTTYGVGAGASLGPVSGGAGGDSGNTAFGYNALNLENNEVQSTAFGYKALEKQNVHPMFATPSNTAIGYEAGKECTLSLADTFVGAKIKSVNAGQSTNNVGVGRSCLLNLQDGFANIALGAYALEGVISAGQNIAIGWQANNGATTGSNNIVIGHQAQPSGLAVGNEITLGNSSVTVIRAAVTSITSLSDERDKRDIVDLTHGLDFISSLRPREFVWDHRPETQTTPYEGPDENGVDVETQIVSANSGKKDFGFIAQEVSEVDDDVLRLVYDANPEKLEMSYGKLVPVLVKAIQELTAKVSALENA